MVGFTIYDLRFTIGAQRKCNQMMVCKTDFGRKVAQKERKGKEGALEMEAELVGMAFRPSCPRRLRRHRPKGLRRDGLNAIPTE
jgi:hypothetical protein